MKKGIFNLDFGNNFTAENFFIKNITCNEEGAFIFA